ncbi:MAG TPA: hypothetical protein VF712_03955 [Thermoleophilaceae bacterium]|jgi:hypothetical protein
MHRSRSFVPRVLTACAAAAALLACAAPSQAQVPKDRKLISEFQDDRVFTRKPPQQVRAALDELQLMGVDMIRTVINWDRLAPAPAQAAVPAGIDLSDPASYAPHDWDPFDLLVREATARGIQIHGNPAGATPAWGSACAVNLYRACLPKPELFKQFVAAVARRYDGTYLDENTGTVLPAIRTWSLWNEPNINSWLNPQTVGTGKRQRRTAARIYRDLFFAGSDALKAGGHASDTILLGETAPIGAPPKRTAPVQFYRDLFCIDARGRRLRGEGAKKLGCAKPRPFKATAVSHHPYVKGAGPPLPKKLTEGAASVGTMDELKRVLRQAAAQKMIRRKVPIWITEFGVSTNPPDQKYGVSLSRAAAYLNQVDRYMWLDPQVRSVSQFEYEDDTGLTPPTFQTGLRYGNGVAKPGLQAYRLPIFVLPDKAKKSNVIVWGWVRAAKGQRQQVAIQIRPQTYGEWSTVKVVATDRYGFLNVSTKRLKGAWRLAWLPPGGAEFVLSRIARVDNFDKAPQPGFGPPGPGGAPAPGPGSPTPDPGSPGPTPTPDPGNPGPTPTPDPVDPGPTPDPNPGPTPDPNPQPTYWNLDVRFNRTRAYPAPPLGPAKYGDGTVEIDPGSTICNTACASAFLEGTTVTLTATAAQDSSFQGWSGGGCSGNVRTCTVTMDRAREVTATFRYELPL